MDVKLYNFEALGYGILAFLCLHVQYLRENGQSVNSVD